MRFSSCLPFVTRPSQPCAICGTLPNLFLPPTTPTRGRQSISTTPNSSLTVARSDTDASCHRFVPKRLVHGNPASQVQDREGRRRETESTQPRLTADSRSLAPNLYRPSYTAFDSSQRRHGFLGQEISRGRAKAVSYQIILQRNALHVIATRCTNYRHDSTPRYSSKHRPIAIEHRPDSGFTGLYLSRRVLTALARSPGSLQSTESRAAGQPLPRCFDRQHPYRSCSWWRLACS